MTPALRAQQKPRSDTRETLRQLVRSHKHLLAAFRAQTEEIGHLRRYILDLRAQHHAHGPTVRHAAAEEFFRRPDSQFRADWPFT